MRNKYKRSFHRSSRVRRGWCTFPACNSLTRLCSDQDKDLMLATTLARIYPTKVMLAQFEYLVKQPKLAIQGILKVNIFAWNVSKIWSQFLGLHWHPALSKFMEDHMVEDPKHKQEGDLHTQSVNSSSKADLWRSKLTQIQLAELDRICGGTIERHQKMRMIWSFSRQANWCNKSLIK